MRYRLRTLLIVLSAVSVPMAWVAYIKQKADYHRQESARVICAINDRSYMPPEFAWDGVARHASQGTEKHEELEDGGLMVFHSGFGRRLVIDAHERADWDRAVSHKRLAAKYDQAILRPWIVLSLSK